MKKLLSAVFMLALPLMANASQVQISATAYSSNNCSYYSTSSADANVSFSNGDLPWGSRVVLRYGFHDKLTGNDWVSTSETEMNGISPYTWASSLKGLQVDARGDSYYDTIEFDFKVIGADGSTTYDNGGSAYGYYQATLPTRNCQATSLQALTVNHVAK